MRSCTRGRKSICCSLFSKKYDRSIPTNGSHSKGPCKGFFERKIWNVVRQLSNEKVYQINVPLKLSILKPIQARWIKNRTVWYSTLSITRILENSNVSKTRTNSPVPWPSHRSLGKKALENSNLDNSNFSISWTLCQSLGQFSLVNSNFHPNFWENSKFEFSNVLIVFWRLLFSWSWRHINGCGEISLL